MTIDLDTRCCGHWITGVPGSGKTTALLSMLASDLQKDASIIVLDAKGELTAPLRKLALGNRLVVLDPVNAPFSINPLDVPKTDVRTAVDVLEYVFGVLLDASVTPKQKSLLRSILRAIIIAFPEPTFRTIQDLIISGPGKYRSSINQLPPDLQEVFTNDWKNYDSTRSELKWRLQLLMENDIVQRMFSAPKNRFKISESMDRGDVVVIDNSIHLLHNDGSAFLGRYFLAQIWSAAIARASRPRNEKKPVFVYLDEADLVIDSTIAAILDRCRSQNIALILAIQRAGQIEDSNVKNALENCGIRMANVDAEAPYFSRLLHIPEERINCLDRGHFATHVRRQEPRIVQFEPVPLPFREMTEAEALAHRQKMIELYGHKHEKENIAECGPSERSRLEVTQPLRRSDPSAAAKWTPPSE